MAPSSRDARGIVAIILAATVGLSALVLSAGAAWAIVDKGLTVPTEVSALVSTVLGALVGSVATYLGLRIDTTPPPVEPPKDEHPE